jgi:PcRGLX-like protein central beta sandwich domain
MSIKSLSTVLAAFLLLALFGRANSGELKLDLTVDNVSAVKLTAEPACGGIPLPWGVYKKDQKFAVLKGGAAIAAQVLPLVVDEKGFLRWVLIDTQIDVPAKGQAKLVLTTGAAGKSPEMALKIENGAEGIKVDTGRIKFAIDMSAPFSLFSSVESGGKKVAGGGEASYTDITDKENVKTYKAGKPTQIKVFESGPMRATIKVLGSFVGDNQTKMRYVAWITCWAGQSRLHVKYLISNSNPEQFTFRMIKDSKISMNLPGAPDAAGNDGVVTSGKVSAHDLYFEVQPRKIEINGGKLLLQGLGTREEASGGKIPWISRNFLLVDSSHHSSQYVFDFSGSDLKARKDADRNVLHIMAAPAWYGKTEGVVVGKFGTQADEMKCYDSWKWTYNKSKAPKGPGYKMPVRRHVHWEDNHYESEADIVESLLLMYLRTGYRSFFKTARAWANYNMDLQVFRTDDWRYKDGAVWWNRGGPSWGNKPQRKKDPVTGCRNGLPNPWYKGSSIGKMAVDKKDLKEVDRMSDSKQCYCHNYGSGLAMWFCLTGERDALEAAIDSVEQNIDSQKRSKGKIIGKANTFSRDFTRSCYLISAIRLVVPNDPFVVAADNHLAQVYVKRPAPELRGLLVPTGAVRGGMKTIQKLTRGKGQAKMDELGLKYDGKKFTDKDGRSWQPVVNPHTWMFTYLGGALDAHYRQTGDEDVMDSCIGYGQAVANILFQGKHFNLDYGGFLVDFPARGFAWDRASWGCGPDTKLGEGIPINGYLATFHPDICARAFEFTGEKLLKQRAYDFWWGGSHRGYNRKKMHGLGGVGTWVNINSDHNETVNMTGRTFYIWSHPRKDQTAPAPVADLKVTVAGNKATLTFTAPADTGGKAVRYQVKCSDRKIVNYQAFLKIYNKHQEKDYCNWFLATNLDGEPAPKAPGSRESFTVSGVPAGAKYFAVRVFDDSSNRSQMSNVTE